MTVCKPKKYVSQKIVKQKSDRPQCKRVITTYITIKSLKKTSNQHMILKVARNLKHSYVFAYG